MVDPPAAVAMARGIPPRRRRWRSARADPRERATRIGSFRALSPRSLRVRVVVRARARRARARRARPHRREDGYPKPVAGFRIRARAPRRGRGVRSRRLREPSRALPRKALEDPRRRRVQLRRLRRLRGHGHAGLGEESQKSQKRSAGGTVRRVAYGGSAPRPDRASAGHPLLRLADGAGEQDRGGQGSAAAARVGARDVGGARRVSRPRLDGRKVFHGANPVGRVASRDSKDERGGVREAAREVPGYRREGGGHVPRGAEARAADGPAAPAREVRDAAEGGRQDVVPRADGKPHCGDRGAPAAVRQREHRDRGDGRPGHGAPGPGEKAEVRVQDPGRHPVGHHETRVHE
mmetsp:Transcript_7890/g.32997  ORF Transcript_7890/g.32997 Transcript_7890/m.32997 type:complete len:350 (-) Transcript_7890:2409-3458(-)